MVRCRKKLMSHRLSLPHVDRRDDRTFIKFTPVSALIWCYIRTYVHSIHIVTDTTLGLYVKPYKIASKGWTNDCHYSKPSRALAHPPPTTLHFTLINIDGVDKRDTVPQMCTAQRWFTRGGPNAITLNSSNARMYVYKEFVPDNTPFAQLCYKLHMYVCV